MLSIWLLHVYIVFVFTLVVRLFHVTEDIPASLSSENDLPGNNEAPLVEINLKKEKTASTFFW